ncbi:hypothetical protein [Nocardia pseudovaccinii]|uniref:hypothetical protein n=1 Tax=Nocardia pseudovaccinii TaxID=189540 RepID=UPI0012F4D3E7|nr:hypothetical protein [Nocardia pseudovaccinii]
MSNPLCGIGIAHLSLLRMTATALGFAGCDDDQSAAVRNVVGADAIRTSQRVRWREAISHLSRTDPELHDVRIWNVVGGIRVSSMVSGASIIDTTATGLGTERPA